MTDEFAPRPTANGLRRQLELQPSRLATTLRAVGKAGAVLVVLTSPAVLLWASARFGGDVSRNLGAGLAWMFAYLLLAIVPCFMVIGLADTLQANKDIAGSMEGLATMYETVVQLAKGAPGEEIALAIETLRDHGLLNADELVELTRRSKGIDGSG